MQRAGNRVPNYRETQNYVKTVLQLYGLLKPPTLAVREGPAPSRVRMELPVGGARGRGNLPAGDLPGVPLAAGPRDEGATVSE